MEISKLEEDESLSDSGYPPLVKSVELDESTKDIESGLRSENKFPFPTGSSWLKFAGSFTIAIVILAAVSSMEIDLLLKPKLIRTIFSPKQSEEILNNEGGFKAPPPQSIEFNPELAKRDESFVEGNEESQAGKGGKEARQNGTALETGRTEEYAVAKVEQSIEEQGQKEETNESKEEGTEVKIGKKGEGKEEEARAKEESKQGGKGTGEEPLVHKVGYEEAREEGSGDESEVEDVNEEARMGRINERKKGKEKKKGEEAEPGKKAGNTQGREKGAALELEENVDAKAAENADMTEAKEKSGEADNEGKSKDGYNNPQRFLFPAFPIRPGSGNQLIAFISAAAIARSLNRTFCLAHLSPSPLQHQFSRVTKSTYGMAVEERFNTSQLAKFVKVASMEECLQACDGRLDTFWKLQVIHDDVAKPWESEANRTIYGRGRVSRWLSRADIVNDFEASQSEKCIGVGGLFPGLQWRGPFLSTSAFLDHAAPIEEAARKVTEFAFGGLKPFIAVHWRFRESMCPRQYSGLCFLRCSLGGNPAMPELLPSDPTWSNATCPKHMVQGVLLSLDGVVGAITDMVGKHGISNVYLATDGFIRAHGCEKLKQVKHPEAWRANGTRRHIFV